MRKSNYRKAFFRIFPAALGICEKCLGPRYHSTARECLSCRQEPDDPIMVEELVRGKRHDED